MELIAAPFVHARKKSRWAPSDVDLSVAYAAFAARGCASPMVVYHENEPIGLVGSEPRGRWSEFQPITYRQWCGFGTYNDIKNQYSTGHGAKAWFRRDASTFTLNSAWADAWPCNGDNGPGTYVGTANTALQFDNTTVGSIPRYQTTPGASETRHLVGWKLSHPGNATRQYILYDRVLTYESVAISNTITNFTNTLAAQRYISAGDWGLQVSVTSQTASGATASNISAMTFTDDQGNTGVSMSTTIPLAIIAGSIAPTNTGGAEISVPSTTSRGYMPWLPLGGTAQGVRKVESVTSSAANTGTLCFALIRPIATMMAVPNSVHHEQLPRAMFNMERIYDTACLSLLFNSQGSTGVVIMGYLEFAQK